MRRHIGVVIVIASFLASLLAIPLTAHAAMGGKSVSRQATVAGYHLELMIGPAEMMSMSGKGGEMMEGGHNAMCSMSAKHSMHMAMCNHHVELHVLKGKTVVKNAHVTITLRNTSTGKSTMLPIATMMAPGKKSDFHYGNNAYLAPGKYMVTVTVNGHAHHWKLTLM